MRHELRTAARATLRIAGEQYQARLPDVAARLADGSTLSDFHRNQLERKVLKALNAASYGPVSQSPYTRVHAEGVRLVDDPHPAFWFVAQADLACRTLDCQGYTGKPKDNPRPYSALFLNVFIIGRRAHEWRGPQKVEELILKVGEQIDGADEDSILRLQELVKQYRTERAQQRSQLQNRLCQEARIRAKLEWPKYMSEASESDLAIIEANRVYRRLIALRLGLIS